MARSKKEESSKELIRELNINKKDLVDEITKEIKESLDKEIEKKIDYESRNKLDKMASRIYREKRWKIIRRDIVILLLLGAVVYEAYILYNNGLFFGLNKKEEVKEVVEEIKKDENEVVEEVKDLAWYKEKYGYLLDNIKTNINGDDKYYLYKANIKASDIKSSIKLNMTYQLLNKEIIDGIIKINEETMKEKYLTIFGNLDAYEATNFTDDCINIIYNKDSKMYMAIDTECTSNNTEIFRQIENIYEENDNIVIEAKVGILNKETNKLSIINGEEFDYNDENIQKLKTYKFIFKDNYLVEINN